MLSPNQLPQNKLLGEILEQAGLVSDEQIQIALAERREIHHLRVGEILNWLDLLSSKRLDDQRAKSIWSSLIYQNSVFGENM